MKPNPILLLLCILLIPSISHATDIELTGMDIVISTHSEFPNSSIVGMTNTPDQKNPDEECYLIDTNTITTDNKLRIPSADVFDLLTIDEQEDPSKEAYIIDAANIIVDKKELKLTNFTNSPVIVSKVKFTYEVDGFVVRFNTTNPDQKYIESYHWDFGDGETSNNPNTTHTYSIIGNHKVTLTITINNGYKSSESKTIHIETNNIKKVIHPREIPIGSEIRILVENSKQTETKLSIKDTNTIKNDKRAEFYINSNNIGLGTHQFTITADEDIYTNTITVYNPRIYQQLLRGLNEIETTSINEMHEIDGITSSTISNHAYSVISEYEISENYTVNNMLEDIRTKLTEIDQKTTEQLEEFDEFMIDYDISLIDQTGELYKATNIIRNVQESIRSLNESLEDENLINTLDRYVMHPAIYRVISTDEESAIKERSDITKSTLNKHYTEEEITEINSMITIAKEAISNTDDEKIYNIHIGTILGKDIGLRPTLRNLQERQYESMNPPETLGHNNPIWVYHMTVADAESLLTIPAYINWIEPTPDNEIISSKVSISVAPIIPTAVIKGIKAYMKYADGLKTYSPWLIDGGMIISTDLLSKEVNEEHEDSIQAINELIEEKTMSSAISPTSTESTIQIPKGNIIATTSLDGKITGFSYIKTDTTHNKPKNQKIISLNTNWSETFETEPQQITLQISSDKQSYEINETANMTITITSEQQLDEAMIWIFIPEENTTIKDIIGINQGVTEKSYNLTIRNNIHHILRAYITDLSTIISQNHTTFNVGTEIMEAGIIYIESEQTYNPGIISINTTIINTGNTAISPRLHHIGTKNTLQGTIETGTIEPNDSRTISQEFNITEPNTYAIQYTMENKNKTIDYNTIQFTVKARDTIIAFPKTDKAFYKYGEKVNIETTIKNISLDIIEMPYILTTTTPNGSIIHTNSFTPTENGTYIVKAKAYKEGYYSVEGETIFIVEKQSSLNIETKKDNGRIWIQIRTEKGTQVEDAQVIINSHIQTTNKEGITDFMMTNDTLIIMAKKFGFNPDSEYIDWKNNTENPEEEQTIISINPQNLDITKNKEAQATIKITPLGEYPLEIWSIICKDTDYDKICDDYLYNNQDGISIIFEDTQNEASTTNSNGEAKIRITTEAELIDNEPAQYYYYIRTNQSEWHEGILTYKQNTNNPSIPEYPEYIIGMILIYTITTISRNIIKNQKEIKI